MENKERRIPIVLGGKRSKVKVIKAYVSVGLSKSLSVF